MACAIASPIRLIRRKIKNTPSGPAAIASANEPAIARRINPKSTKGAINQSINMAKSLPHKDGAPNANFLVLRSLCLALEQSADHLTTHTAGNASVPFPFHVIRRSRYALVHAIQVSMPIRPASCHCLLQQRARPIKSHWPLAVSCAQTRPAETALPIGYEYVAPQNHLNPLFLKRTGYVYARLS